MAEYKNWDIEAGCAEAALKQAEKQFNLNNTTENKEAVVLAKHKAELYRDRANTISDYINSHKK